MPLKFIGGDGSLTEIITTYNDVRLAHSYEYPGEYSIRISGMITGMCFGETASASKLYEIESWGNFRFTVDATHTFLGCSNLTITATDSPSLLGVTKVEGLFKDCTSLSNPDLGSWMMSSVSSFKDMFSGCTNFNADISSWDVHFGVLFTGMFNDCTNFNQDIGGWDTSSAINLSNMFRNCVNFNQDISGWDITHVTTMSGMFANVSLNPGVYNNLLEGWEAQAVQDNVVFDGGVSLCSEGSPEIARTALINDHSWTITDGGQFSGLYGVIPQTLGQKMEKRRLPGSLQLSKLSLGWLGRETN